MALFRSWTVLPVPGERSTVVHADALRFLQRKQLLGQDCLLVSDCSGPEGNKLLNPTSTWRQTTFYIPIRRGWLDVTVTVLIWHN